MTKKGGKARKSTIPLAVPAQHRPERLTHTVEEAGAILGVSRNSAYALARTGAIPTIRLGKRLLVPQAGLESLLRGDLVA
jgi:excisionase family DNA binding protein